MRQLQGTAQRAERTQAATFARMGKNAAGNFGKSFKSGLSGLGTGIVSGLVGALGFDALRKAIESVGNIGDLARDLGVSTDALQIFQKAMQLAGGDADDMTKVIANMQDELRESDSVLSTWLRDNNIDATKLSTEELLTTILKVSQSLPSDQRLALFRDGLKLRPGTAVDLAEAATHIEEAGKAARISADDIAKLDRLAEQMTDGFQRAGVMFADFLASLTDTGKTEDAINGIVEGFGAILTTIRQIITTVKELGPYLKEIQPLLPKPSDAEHLLSIRRQENPLIGEGLFGGLIDAIEQGDWNRVGDEILKGILLATPGGVGARIVAEFAESPALKQAGTTIGQAAADILKNATVGAGLSGAPVPVVPGDAGTRVYQALDAFSARFGTEVAKGIVAGLQGESGRGLNPLAEGDKGLPGGSSFGIAQWREERLAALREFAAEHKASINDFSTQLAFIFKELSENPALLKALENARTSEEALALWVRHFERPKHPEEEIRRRQQFLRVGPQQPGAAGPKTEAQIREEARLLEERERALEKAREEAAERAKYLDDKRLQLEIQKAEAAGNKELAVSLETIREARSKGIEQGTKEFEQLQLLNEQQAGLVAGEEKRAQAIEREIQALERKKALAEATGDKDEVTRLEAEIEARRQNVELLSKEGQEILHNREEWQKTNTAIDQYQSTVQQVQQLNDALASAAQTFANGLLEGKSAADALKAALHQLASQLLSMAIQGLFSAGGRPGGLLGGLLGFQHGGHFKVGGSGGPDSQMVAFRATPGEEVSINPRRFRPGAGAGSGTAFAFSTNVTVNGNMDDQMLFRMKRMMEANNVKQRRELERDFGNIQSRYGMLRGP